MRCCWVPELGLTPAWREPVLAASLGVRWRCCSCGQRRDERAVCFQSSSVEAPGLWWDLVSGGAQSTGVDHQLDEEHDGDYKREGRRYHGRDVAVMRAKLNEAAVVLGRLRPRWRAGRMRRRDAMRE